MGLGNTLFESLPDVVTVKLDAVVNWARKSSLGRDLACLRAIDMMIPFGSHDLSRFGAELFDRATPGGFMIVSVRVSRKMALPGRIYDHMLA